MLCGAIDIGSNTTRLLVAEPAGGPAPQGDGAARLHPDRQGRLARTGKITAEKIAEVAEVVTTQVRLAEEMGAEAIRTVATAAIREAKNRDKVVEEIEEVAGVEVDVLERGGGGPPRLHRRDQDARPPGRGRRSPSSTSAAAPPR